MFAWLINLIHRFCLPKRWLTVEQLAELHGEFYVSELDARLFDGMWWQADADKMGERVADLVLRHGLQLSDRAMTIINGETWRQQFGAKVFAALTAGTTCHCCLGWRVILLVVCCAGAGFAAGRL